ncbi:Uncharacterised protein [Amycolatopsis camponoti]|uniref:Secreted protein n=1 Tax=Amycolatopsis camponoti TaxID=2606593 RepID=A0A6I8M0L9_9PSEU|nr:hypothetical protein [Amycolatopsis camponoti]VVJ23335.1 Uncharacterised protein [Amycolatopsis camponoti]
MRALVRGALVTAALATGGALALGGTAAFATSASTNEVVVAGPFDWYDSCHRTQQEYQRYYTIVQGCFQLTAGNDKWIFTYDNTHH